MDTVETVRLILNVIAVLVSISALFVSFFFNNKNSKKTDVNEIVERATKNAEMNVKLDSMVRSMEEIKKQNTAIMDEINKHNDRIIKVEESLKSLHHRVNTMEERLNHEG